MKPTRRQTRKEFNQDKRSIERFSAMREAFEGASEHSPTRLQRLGAGITHLAHEVVDVFKETLREGREADARLDIKTAELHLEQGYSTEQDLAALRENGQSVIIKTPWQR